MSAETTVRSRRALLGAGLGALIVLSIAAIGAVILTQNVGALATANIASMDQADLTRSLTGVAGQAPDVCVLEYQRADNMWAAQGRPDGNLGVESITLAPGQSRVFNTDWAYEKRRNDGTTYYGSHLRIAESKGPRPVQFRNRWNGITFWSYLSAAGGSPSRVATRSDLMEVRCVI